jgi:hypothetical protein
VSRSFNGTSDHLIRPGIPADVNTWTFAAWVKSSSASAAQTTIALNRATSFPRGWELLLNGSIAGDPVEAATETGSRIAAPTSSGYTVAQWHHIAASFSGGTLRAYLDGGARGETVQGTGPTLSTANRTTIGAATANGTLLRYFEGLIAHPAIWSTALSDSQIADLAGGALPTAVGSPISYWPLTSGASPEPDAIASFDLTVDGATYSSDEPPALGGGPPPSLTYPAALLMGT